MYKICSVDIYLNSDLSFSFLLLPIKLYTLPYHFTFSHQRSLDNLTVHCVHVYEAHQKLSDGQDQALVRVTLN